MTFTKVQVISGSDKLMSGNDNYFIGNIIYQRQDGVLVCYYWANGYYVAYVSYSYDHGATWTQKAELNAYTGYSTALALLNNYESHFTWSGGHTKNYPCDAIESLTYAHSITFIDNNNYLSSVYGELDGVYKLKYSRLEGTTWTTPETIISPVSDNGISGTKTCVDSNNKIHILFAVRRTYLETSYNKLFYMNNVSGSWSVPVTILNSTTYQLSSYDMCIDNNDNVNIVYSTRIIGDPSTNRSSNLIYGIYNGTTFDEQQLVAFGIGDILTCKISFDENNNLHIIYNRNLNEVGSSVYNIFYMKSEDSGGSWSSEEAITSEVSGYGYSFNILKKEFCSSNINIQNNGICGVYFTRNNTPRSLYFFYTNDCEFKYDVAEDSTYCYNQVIHATSSCVNLTAKVFTGLDHLEGQEVSIIADGEVLTSQTVVSGQITLDKNYASVIVGLPYASDLHTLREELQDDEGTIQGKKVKIGNVTVGFVESKSGFIGENEDSLYEAFTDYKVSQNEIDLEFESSSDLDEANLYTGDIRVPLGSRYRNGASLLFRQTKPLPVTISRLIKEIDVAESSQ